MKIIFESEIAFDSTNFLLKSAYIENKFLLSQGCDTWYSGLQRLFKIYVITIQEFTICLNISIIHLKEKFKI
jgi:hypothetical protein